MKTRFKLVLIPAAVLLTGIAVTQTVDVSGKWVLTGLDPEGPGIARITTSASGGFRGVYTAGLTEDGYHCDIRDGKVSKSEKVSFTLVCGSDEIETKVSGHITKNGSIKGKYITMTKSAK
ncbi:MAG TPA: hypothetical protein VGE85_05005 [Terracidiphilus sp.]|jgi:hypothetical protein